MIVLVGVGHVFNLSSQIEEIVKIARPNMVCVELDPYRYQALLEKRRGEGEGGIRGGRSDAPLIFQILARFQEAMARSYNVMAGGEMLAAVDVAREVGAKVALIDMDIHTVLQRFRGRNTMLERVKLMAYMAMAFVVALIRPKKRKNVKTIEEEIKDFEKDPDTYIKELEAQFPILKRELIDARDEHMARNVMALRGRYERVVVVVGAGHINGMLRWFKALGCEMGAVFVVRLTSMLSKDSGEYRALIEKLRSVSHAKDSPSDGTGYVAEGSTQRVGMRFEINVDNKGGHDG